MDEKILPDKRLRSAKTMNYLALDLGGSHVGCAVVSGGRVLASTSVSTGAQSVSALLPKLKAELTELCAQVHVHPRDCGGLSIGVPAIVDSDRGEILSTLNKFEDLSGSRLKLWSERELGVSARIENDAKLALLGERLAGAGRDCEDLVMVTLGTGIGVAAMLQNRLLVSRLGQAGCVGGHFTIRLGGRLCACGNLGCAEAEASTAALPAICGDWPGFHDSLLAREATMDFAALFRARGAGDQVAEEVLARCVDVWSALTVSLIHAYGPQRVLFGGGVMRRSSEILPRIRTYVEQHVWATNRGSARIEVAALGEAAGLVGAEALLSGSVQ